MAFRTNKTPVLQEKTASGAVASFNTALAMPLASCNIAVNAWQEGSGDPSPSNVRPIHGFSEVNVTANNVVYTIQLGEEVYGAEVDVVNGVAHVTHYGMTLDGTENIMANPVYHYLSIPCPYNHRLNDNTDCISSHYLFGGNKPRLSMGNLATVIWFFPEEDSPYYDNAEAFKSYLAQEYANGTPVQIVYPIVEPFDIQLTPTQIETLIGNNTIFADTGDIDLTFNDLDIAKRGSFREVFKLP